MVRLQSLARGYLVRQKLDKLRACREIRLFLEQKDRAAQIIQSYWRGFKIRCQFLHKKRVSFNNLLLHGFSFS